MEKYLDLTNSEHYTLVKKLVEGIKRENINKILDAGSGKTSLSILLDLFPSSKIDAIVFYGDLRKINSLSATIVSNRYQLMEKDICKDNISNSYDLILAHLLLGEAIKWGNTVADLLLSLIKINSKYLIVYDFKEDISINYNYLEKTFQEYYLIIKKEEILKSEPQDFGNFIGKTYIAYLLERKNS